MISLAVALASIVWAAALIRYEQQVMTGVRFVLRRLHLER